MRGKKIRLLDLKKKKQDFEAERVVSGKHAWAPRPRLLCGLLSISSMKTVMVAADPSTQMANFSEPGPNWRLPRAGITHSSMQ